MGGNSLWTEGLKRLAFLLLALILAGIGLLISSWSFSKIHHMRQLERVPRTPVSAIISGEVNLSGRVAADSELLESPDTNTRGVYYRYHVERRERDSDGDTRWKTVKDVRRSVDFRLEDSSGDVLIEPSDAVDFDIKSDSRRTSGSKRYTEYVLEPGSKAFVFGFASRAREGYSVRFDTEGSFVPIISEDSARGERQDMALWSAIALLAGLAALSFTVVFLLGVFRLHHSAIYLIGVTSVMVGALAFQGLAMMKADLEDAEQRAQRALTEGQSVLEERLDAAGVDWDGDWSALGSFSDDKYDRLDLEERKRLSRVRLGLAQSVERANENLDRFPESLLAPVWGVDRFDPLPLPEADQERLARLEQDHEPTRVNSTAALIGLLLGALGTVLASWRGLKKVSTKRTIENVPTSPIEGVAYGLCEIKGAAELADDQPRLHGPITNRDCLYYRHVIKRKKSNDDGWTTVRDDSKSVPFFCRDDSAAILVDPSGARFLAEQTHTKRAGSKKHIETRIEPGERIYALGSAEVDPDTHDKLQLGDGHGELPFIVSSLPEQAVMQKEAQSAFYLLNTGLLAAIMAALGLAGTQGSFGPMLYTTAAAFACIYLFVMLFFLYYNDLVFLRERVERNWSNIDVALKKRFDLISSLEDTVKGYLAHENDLHETLAQARSAREGSEAADPADDTALAAEARARNHIVATVEAYPQLKGEEMVTRLMNSLTDVENEIALMRDGYNDAVERFNTRQHKFPEVFVAKLFGFKKASHFRTFGAEREAPEVAAKLPN